MSFGSLHGISVARVTLIAHKTVTSSSLVDEIRSGQQRATKDCGQVSGNQMELQPTGGAYHRRRVEEDGAGDQEMLLLGNY